MPRSKKTEDGYDRHRLIANFWTQQINRGIEARKEYDSQARKVDKYLQPQHKELVEDESLAAHGATDGACVVSVPKLRQIISSLGPRLYPVHPARKITPDTNDGVMLALSRVLGAFLKYSAREGKLRKQLKKSIDDSIKRGRGVLYQTKHKKRGIICSKYIPSTDFVFDPDYVNIEDAKWIAFRRTEQLWEIERRITEKWRIKGLRKPLNQRKMDSESSPGVDYWVVLSRMGVGWRGMSDHDDKKRKDNKDFVRLEIKVHHEFPLSEGNWEVPFYHDEEWPVSTVDLIDSGDKHYPDSIGGLIVSSQQAVDIISTAKLTGIKNRERLLAMIDAEAFDAEAAETLRSGGASELISVNKPNGMTWADALHVPNWGVGSSEAPLEREFHLRTMEDVSGVNDSVHGGQAAGAKDRSATASQNRANAAGVRLEDLVNSVEAFMTDAARKEAILTRLTLKVDEVEPAVGPEKINMFYISVTVPGDAEVPVRDFDEETLSLMDIYPPAGTFFESMDDAMQALQQLVVEAEAEDADPKIASLWRSIKDKGVIEGTQIPQRVSVAPVTVTQVWEATAGVTAQELMKEFSYELEAGSTNKQDKAAAREHVASTENTWMPIAMQISQLVGNFEPVDRVLRVRYNAFDVPEDQRVYFNDIPIPPPQPAPGGDPGAQGA